MVASGFSTRNAGGSCRGRSVCPKASWGLVSALRRRSDCMYVRASLIHVRQTEMRSWAHGVLFVAMPFAPRQLCCSAASHEESPPLRCAPETAFTCFIWLTSQCHGSSRAQTAMNLVLWQSLCSGQNGTVGGPQRPHKHKDPTSHDFWYPACIGPKLLVLMWSFLPLSTWSVQRPRMILACCFPPHLAYLECTAWIFLFLLCYTTLNYSILYYTIL